MRAHLSTPGLRFDFKIVFITIFSTLALTVAHYHTAWRGVLLFLVLPLAITLFFFHEHPREYGFQLGDWKAGLVLTVGALLFLFTRFLIW